MIIVFISDGSAQSLREIPYVLIFISLITDINNLNANRVALQSSSYVLFSSFHSMIEFESFMQVPHLASYGYERANEYGYE